MYEETAVIPTRKGGGGGGGGDKKGADEKKTKERDRMLVLIKQEKRATWSQYGLCYTFGNLYYVNQTKLSETRS